MTTLDPRTSDQAPRPSTVVLDLRGQGSVAAAAPVLEDPSGARARRLAVAGRVLAGVFLLWLLTLTLAGLGLLPAGRVPLGGQVARSAPQPPRVTTPSVTTRLPARRAVPSTVAATGGATGATQSQGNSGAAAPSTGNGHTAPAGNSASSSSGGAPSTTASSSAATAPGSAHRGGSTAQGQAKGAPATTTSDPVPTPAPGGSGAAPGQTGTTPGSAHAHGG